MPSPTTTAASPSAPRATTTAPSPTTPRRSGSIRNTPRPTTTAAIAYRAKGDLDRAIADYSEAIRLDPKIRRRLQQPRHRVLAPRATSTAPSPTTARRSSSIPNADWPTTTAASRISTLATSRKRWPISSQASELDPKYAYYALWLDIVDSATDCRAVWQQATAQIDMTKWPAPVIRLFLGQLTPAAVLAAADDPDPTTKKGQVCEANFYSGELALRRSAKDEAARLFRLAASDCPKSFTEWGAANAELKALGAAP